jgi:hypothetical protein
MGVVVTLNGKFSIMFFIFAFLAVSLLSAGVVFASSIKGTPISAVNDSTSGGTVPWTSPTNVYLSDNSSATASLGNNDVTYYNKITNFKIIPPFLALTYHPIL